MHHESGWRRCHSNHLFLLLMNSMCCAKSHTALNSLDLLDLFYTITLIDNLLHNLYANIPVIEVMFVMNKLNERCGQK